MNSKTLRYNLFVLSFLTVFSLNSKKSIGSISNYPKCWSRLTNQDITNLEKINHIKTIWSKKDLDEQLKLLHKELKKNENSKEISIAIFATIGLIQTRLSKKYRQSSMSYKSGFFEEIIIKSINKKIIKLLNLINRYNNLYIYHYQAHISKIKRGHYSNKSLTTLKRQEDIETKLIALKNMDPYEIHRIIFPDPKKISDDLTELNLQNNIRFITEDIEKDLMDFIEIQIEDNHTLNKEVYLNINDFLTHSFKPLNLDKVKGRIINFIYPYFSYDMINLFFPVLRSGINHIGINSNKFWCSLAATEQMTIDSSWKHIRFKNKKSIINKSIELIIKKNKNDTKWSNFNFQSNLLDSINENDVSLDNKSQIEIGSLDEIHFNKLEISLYKNFQEILQLYKSDFEKINYDLYNFFDNDNTIFNIKILKTFDKSSTFLSINSDLVDAYRVLEDIKSKIHLTKIDEIDNYLNLLFTNKTLFTIELIRLIAIAEHYKTTSDDYHIWDVINWDMFFIDEAKKYFLPYNRFDSIYEKINPLVGEITLFKNSDISLNVANEYGLRNLMAIYFLKHFNFTEEEINFYLKSKRSKKIKAYDFFKINNIQTKEILEKIDYQALLHD